MIILFHCNKLIDWIRYNIIKAQGGRVSKENNYINLNKGKAKRKIWGKKNCRYFIWGKIVTLSKNRAEIYMLCMLP